MAPSACSSRARCFASARAWARNKKQFPAIRPVSRWTVPSTRAASAPSSAQSSTTLLTLTVDEEYQIEIAFLQAQVDHLIDVRDRILGLDDESQVTVLAHGTTHMHLDVPWSVGNSAFFILRRCPSCAALLRSAGLFRSTGTSFQIHALHRVNHIMQGHLSFQ